MVEVIFYRNYILPQDYFSGWVGEGYLNFAYVPDDFGVQSLCEVLVFATKTH